LLDLAQQTRQPGHSMEKFDCLVRIAAAQGDPIQALDGRQDLIDVGPDPPGEPWSRLQRVDVLDEGLGQQATHALGIGPHRQRCRELRDGFVMFLPSGRPVR
jgi:hypothetical protein